MAQTSHLFIPMVVDTVSAGEPRPFVSATQRVNLKELFIGDSKTCVLIRIRGNSRSDIPILNGDWVIVDTGRVPKPNDIVIAELNGSFLIKRHKLNNGAKRGLYLVPASDQFEPREITAEDHYSIWGVVRKIIHSVD